MADDVMADTSPTTAPHNPELLPEILRLIMVTGIGLIPVSHPLHDIAGHILDAVG